MSPEISDLLKRALALSVDERAALANTLPDSLERADESAQEDWEGGDFEMIPAVASKAIGALSNGELTFAFPEVLDVIKICSANQIAVLGPDLFRLRSDGLYETEKLSAYHLEMKSDPKRVEEWPDYVQENNSLAEQFVRANPAGDHLYVLTTASWREFQNIRKQKRQQNHGS
jgi:hypothetical protein